MSAFRYLLNVAYIGTPFRGSQRQTTRGLPRLDDPLTVQGRLEMGLKLLKPSIEPIVHMSSRTDSGVHAINATCHVDLSRQNGMMYPPNSITICLNKYFSKFEVPIRVIKTYLVPKGFSSRHNAVSRTYMYRLSIAKGEKLRCAPHLKYIPIEELNRTLLYCTNTFDLDKMKEGASLFEGYHDFRTFMAKSQKEPHKCTRRVVEYIKIQKTDRPGYSLHYSWPSIHEVELDDYLFVDVYMKSSGYLYKQVRRTVAALVALAQGIVTIRDLKLMLEVPSHFSWSPCIKTLPAHGLYLCQVEYAKEDLDSFRVDSQIEF